MRSVIALLLLAGSTAAFAQKPPAACGLITPAQLKQILGMNAGPGKETDVVINAGTFKGQTMTLCTWTVPQGTISMNVLRVSAEQRIKALTEMQKEQIRMEVNLKQQGWTAESTNTAGLRCLTAIPPPALNAKKVPTGMSCSADVVKGLALSLGANLVATKVPPAKMKTLYDTVVKRF